MKNNTLINDNKKQIPAQYRIDEDGNLVLVYVNHNDRKKWYEIYNVSTNCFYEVGKVYILDKTKKASYDYISLTKGLLSDVFKNDNIKIIKRLPRL